MSTRPTFGFPSTTPTRPGDRSCVRPLPSAGLFPDSPLIGNGCRTEKSSNPRRRARPSLQALSLQALSLRHDLLVAAWRAGGRNDRHGPLRLRRYRNVDARIDGRWRQRPLIPRQPVAQIVPRVPVGRGNSLRRRSRCVGRCHRRVRLVRRGGLRVLRAGDTRQRHARQKARQQSGRSRHPTRTSQVARRSPITQMRCRPRGRHSVVAVARMTPMRSKRHADGPSRCRG